MQAAPPWRTVGKVPADLQVPTAYDLMHNWRRLQTSSTQKGEEEKGKKGNLERGNTLLSSLYLKDSF